ncbi:MAG: chromosome segregation protein SMC [Clostridia bacterium]|nr:chromosome segregation protein SMC [Clostridia bacterium]
MRLLSLELHGFKSFPDKTLLKFAHGVTTVVGPNGSGKSNISDAVRWVLGEISSKSIRGSKMDDVIFNGSDTRKPMNFAEVSITLDNRAENGFQRMPIDYDEVTITRRISRKKSGSDYFINRQPARLKDINELFMNTGIGRDGYSIVSQGKAAEIISQKSDERRSVFEEAAGISKYRHQKTDAERKLAETALNCERIADILAEKKAILERLEKDAERAKKYLDIYEKKKEADISLAIYDLRNTIEKINNLQNTFENARAALLAVDNNISDAEAERDRIELLRAQTKELYARLTTEIDALNTSKYRQDTNAQVLRNEVEHMKQRVLEFEAQLGELLRQLGEHTEHVEAAEIALRAVRDRYNAAEIRRDEINADLSQQNARLDEYDLSIEQNLSDTDAATDRQIECKMKIAELEGTARSSENRRVEINEELKNIEESMARCSEGMQRHKAKLEAYQEQSDKIREKGEENSANVAALQRKIGDLNGEISSLASDLRDIRTRTETLRRMEELFEGYPHSVSAIMNASKAGKLTGIIGPLSHIFTVIPRYAVPIETALATNLQNIVCETDDAATAAIEWLKNNNAGRTTFYPLTTMQVSPLPIDIKTLDSYRGFMGIASEMVEYEPKFDNVIKSLLGRTLVFDTLNNAKYFSRAVGQRIRIVTMDGQQINTGGSFTGGSKRKESGLLNRSAEIERLNADKIRTEAAKNAAQDELDKATRALNDLLAASDSFATKIKLLNTLYQAEMSQYSAYEAQLNTIAETGDRLREQLSDMDSANARIENEKNELLRVAHEASENEARLLTERAALNEKKVSITQAIKETTARLNAALMEIVGLNKDVENAERELDFRKSQRTDCENAINQTKLNIEALKENIKDTAARISESSEKVVEMDAELSRKSSEREKANSDSIMYEQKLSMLNLRLQEQMRAREIVSNDYTKLEAKLSEARSEQDRLINYMADEYSLTFSEAEALNYPPVTQENRAEIASQLNELKYKLRGIGSVDPSTIEQYKSAKDAYDELNYNFEDMEKSRASYEETVNKLEESMRVRFIESIGEINEAFQRSFSELFGGGRAEVVLTDMDDVLHCGIDINVCPPGKIIKSLTLLSGGEQAFISIALVFALLHVNPSPFCIFDEIEAALDEVNVAMFANYIKKYSDNTQFITITHRRGTMEVGDTLYGVTMAERGISRVLTLNVSEVEDKLGVKL